jgi:putative transposase
MFARDERQRFLEVAAQFIRRPRLARIIPRGHESATKRASEVLEPTHVIALPAVERNGDLRERFERGLHIHAESGVTFAGKGPGAFEGFGHGWRDYAANFPPGNPLLMAGGEFSRRTVDGALRRAMATQRAKRPILPINTRRTMFGAGRALCFPMARGATPSSLRFRSVADTLVCMSDHDAPQRPKVYVGFGGRLFHRMPEWVRDDAIFHIRVRCMPDSRLLTEPDTARAILDSARLYHERHRWCAHLFLLMPNHWHALLSFPADASMSRVVGDWKRYHARQTGVIWQDGYFDHRLRAHLEQLDAKATYIRRNPVAAGLCAREQDWPWHWSAEDLVPDTRPESSQR